MASPLAEIDWDNLGSANLVTAMNLLELAYSERANMPALVSAFRGGRGGWPDINLYPWLNNNPQYGKDDWPMLWASDDFDDRTLNAYLSQTKIDNALGTIVPGSGFSYSNYKQDEAQIFLDHAITAWPTMDIINPIDVKKWYDIITSLKKICVEYHYHSGNNYIESYAEGIMKQPINFPQYGQVWYEGGPNPPQSQLPTDWALLFTGPQTKQVVSKLFPYFNQPLNAYIRMTASRYSIYNTKGYSRFSNADYVNTGLIGIPESIAYGSYNFYQNGAVDYVHGLGSQSLEIRQLGAVTRTALAGNILERSLAVPVMPEPTYSGSTIDFSLDTPYAIYENWDIEGGFIYYTP